MPQKILRPAQVCERLGISHSALYRRIANDPGFPKKVLLGPRTAGFVEAEIDRYIRVMVKNYRENPRPVVMPAALQHRAAA